MKRFLSGLIVVAIISIGCGGSSEPLVKSETGSKNSVFPGWYSSFGFTSDSTSFYGYGTAVSADEETARSKAELEARAILESYIAKELEDIRSDLERDGSQVVKQKDFILKLRNAHYKVEEEAELVQSNANSSDGVYRGFAEVKISKMKVKSLIENGLDEDSYVESESFRDLFER